jgi:hypothetical protein
MVGPKWEKLVREDDAYSREVGRNAWPFIVAATIAMLAVGYLMR